LRRPCRVGTRARHGRTEGEEKEREGRGSRTDGESLGREEALDQTLLEENLDDLLEDGQQASVVDPHAPLQEGEEGDDLGEGLVLLGEGIDGVGEDLTGGSARKRKVRRGGEGEVELAKPQSC